MPQENDNNQIIRQAIDEMHPKVKERLKEIAYNRQQAKQKSDAGTIDHLSASAINLDNKSYEVDNENLSNEYKKNSQLASVALMVKYAAEQNGADWSNLRTVSDIMSNYFNRFPETSTQVKEFINSDRDPEEFGIEMGWLENDRQEKSLNWLERVWNDIKHPFDMFVQGAYDLTGYLERVTGNTGYADTLALDEYAYRKYGKVIANMTEDEIKRLELDLAIKNAQNGTYIMGDGNASVGGDIKYTDADRQRLDVAGTEIGLGGTLSVLELAYPKAAGALTALGETPIVNFPIQLFGEGGRLIGDLVSMIPGVDTRIASLPEDLQEDVKSIGGMLILGKAIGKGATKDGELRPQIKNIIENISSSEIIGGIMDYIKNNKYIKGIRDINENTIPTIMNGIKDVINNPKEWTESATSNLWKTVKEFTKSSDYKKLLKEQKMENNKIDAAGRISGETSGKRAIEQTEIVNRELERLKDTIGEDIIKNIKTDEELYDVINEHGGRYEAWEDGIYSRSNVRYKPGESRWVQNMKDTETGISAKPIEVDPIGNGLKYLKQIYKNNRNMLQQLDIIEKRWKTKGLTRGEANQLARQIAEGAKIYKEASRDMYSAEYVEEIEQARRDLKDWARAPFKDTVPGLYKALEYLDNAWSDNLNTKAMIKGNMEETRGYKNKYPKQEDWQKQGSIVSRTIKSKGANVADFVFKNRSYNPITRGRDLNNNLKDWLKNDSKVGRENIESAVKDWYDKTFRDVVNPDGTSYNMGEGEVINPKKTSWRDNRNYLEDIVQIVEDADIIEDAKGGLDFKYGGLENQLKSLGLSDAEVAAAEQAIYQGGLFGGEPTKVGEIEGGVIKKTSKSNKSNKKTSEDKSTKSDGDKK